MLRIRQSSLPGLVLDYRGVMEIPIQFREQCPVCGEIFDIRNAGQVSLHSIYNPKLKKYECCPSIGHGIPKKVYPWTANLHISSFYFVPVKVPQIITRVNKPLTTIFRFTPNIGWLYGLINCKRIFPIANYEDAPPNKGVLFLVHG